MSTSTMKQRFGSKKSSPPASSPSSSPSSSSSSSSSSAPTSLDSSVKSFVDSWTPAGVKFEDIVWFNLFFLVFVHAAALFGLALVFIADGGYTLLGLAVVGYYVSGLGITAGAHRLWSHKAFHAHWTVRLVLAALNSAAYEGSILTWSMDHRAHHKGSETTSDPYSYARGFAFAHVGWVCLRKHPDVISSGKKIDYSDLHADPIVAWQHKLYLPSVFLFCYAIPTAIGTYFTGDAFSSFFIVGVLRHVILLHATWLVNSLAHMPEHGSRPYACINAAENVIVSLLAVGEGWHNYHHAFPTDYRAAEGMWWQWNPSSVLIRLLCALGLAWDLRTTSPALIEKHKDRTAKRRAAGVSVLAPELRAEDEVEDIE